MILKESQPKGLTVWERFPQLKEIPENKFPKHVLIIPDGNGRWAEKFNSLPIVGHKSGYEVLKEVLRDLSLLPINIVTIWGFAADNWKRPTEEINKLMGLFEKAIAETLPELLEKNRRLIHLGRKDRIPPSLEKIIEEAEKETRYNAGQKLCLAIDFGGKDQNLRIIQEIARNVEKGHWSLRDINESLVETLRDGYGAIPPADLTIRTSGEQRTSDLGWLVENTEFYSIKEPLPDTTTKHFVAAIVDFSKRQRRFGGRPEKTQKS